jgi:hypothetical protein
MFKPKFKNEKIGIEKEYRVINEQKLYYFPVRNFRDLAELYLRFLNENPSLIVEDVVDDIGSGNDTMGYYLFTSEAKKQAKKEYVLNEESGYELIANALYFEENAEKAILKTYGQEKKSLIASYKGEVKGYFIFTSQQ